MFFAIFLSVLILIISVAYKIVAGRSVPEMTNLVSSGA